MTKFISHTTSFLLFLCLLADSVAGAAFASTAPLRGARGQDAAVSAYFQQQALAGQALQTEHPLLGPFPRVILIRALSGEDSSPEGEAIRQAYAAMQKNRSRAKQAERLAFFLGLSPADRRWEVSELALWEGVSHDAISSSLTNAAQALKEMSVRFLPRTVKISNQTSLPHTSSVQRKQAQWFPQVTALAVTEEALGVFEGLQHIVRYTPLGKEVFQRAEKVEARDVRFFDVMIEKVNEVSRTPFYRLVKVPYSKPQETLDPDQIRRVVSPDEFKKTHSSVLLRQLLRELFLYSVANNSWEIYEALFIHAQQASPSSRPIVDLFGGSGAMAMTTLQSGDLIVADGTGPRSRPTLLRVEKLNRRTIRGTRLVRGKSYGWRTSYEHVSRDKYWRRLATRKELEALRDAGGAVRLGSSSSLGYPAPSENRRRYWRQIEDPLNQLPSRRFPGLGHDHPEDPFEKFMAGRPKTFAGKMRVASPLEAAVIHAEYLLQHNLYAQALIILTPIQERFSQITERTPLLIQKLKEMVGRHYPTEREIDKSVLLSYAGYVQSLVDMAEVEQAVESIHRKVPRSAGPGPDLQTYSPLQIDVSGDSSWLKDHAKAITVQVRGPKTMPNVLAAVKEFLRTTPIPLRQNWTLLMKDRVELRVVSQAAAKIPLGSTIRFAKLGYPDAEKYVLQLFRTEHIITDIPRRELEQCVQWICKMATEKTNPKNLTIIETPEVASSGGPMALRVLPKTSYSTVVTLEVSTQSEMAQQILREMQDAEKPRTLSHVGPLRRSA